MKKIYYIVPASEEALKIWHSLGYTGGEVETTGYYFVNRETKEISWEGGEEAIDEDIAYIFETYKKLEIWAENKQPKEVVRMRDIQRKARTMFDSKDTNNIVKFVLDELGEIIARGDQFKFPSWGTVHKNRIRDRTGYDFQRQEKVTRKNYSVKWKTSQAFRAKMRNSR